MDCLKRGQLCLSDNTLQRHHSQPKVTDSMIGPIPDNVVISSHPKNNGFQHLPDFAERCRRPLTRNVHISAAFQVHTVAACIGGGVRLVATSDESDSRAVEFTASRTMTISDSTPTDVPPMSSVPDVDATISWFSNTIMISLTVLSARICNRHKGGCLLNWWGRSETKGRGRRWSKLDYDIPRIGMMSMSM